MIYFDPDTHTYRDEAGEEFTSVSRALSEAGIVDKRWFTEEAANKGNKVHDAVNIVLCEYLGEGDFEDEALLGYIAAAKKFVSENKMGEIFCSEKIVWDFNRRIAGTLDMVFIDSSGDKVLVDWKTGNKLWWHPIQLAAYSKMFPKLGGSDGIKNRITVQLLEKGDYKIHSSYKGIPYRDVYWDNLWLAVATITDAKSRMGK